jgi:hypothetical protein
MSTMDQWGEDVDYDKERELRNWSVTVRFIALGLFGMFFLVWFTLRRDNTPKPQQFVTITPQRPARIVEGPGGPRAVYDPANGSRGPKIVDGNSGSEDVSEAGRACRERLTQIRELIAGGPVQSLSELGYQGSASCPDSGYSYVFAPTSQAVACRTIGHELF